MKRIALLVLWLALQGVTVPSPRGAASGVLRRTDGSPAPGVRLSAMAKPETAQEVAGSTLVSITQTDAEGRFRLEIPPGFYYIVAGRVDLPTYYPGTSEIADGRLIEVTPGAALSGLDFTISDSSVRTSFTDVFRAVGTVSIPVRLTGPRIPFSSAAGAVTLQFERLADGSVTSVPMTNQTANLQYLVAANATDFRVSVANLPPGYTAQAITQDGKELPGGLLHITPAVPVSSLQATFGWLPTNAATAPVNFSLLTTSLGIPSPIVSPIVFAISSPQGFPNRMSGVRVTGRGRPGDTHPVYLSGRQGMTFTDGTFQFADVPPGRHTLALVDTPGRTMGATVVVEDQDLSDVQLDDVPILPTDIQEPKQPSNVTHQLTVGIEDLSIELTSRELF